MNHEQILQDFKRRYEQSFIWVAPPDSSEESLFFVNRITNDRCNIANLEMSSPEYGKIILNMGSAHTLRFKHPPVGVFQHGADALMFRRIPAKQYKFGVYYGNSCIVPVFNKIMGKRMHNEAELDFVEVLSAFHAQTYTFRDALRMLSGGKYRSVALARNYSLMLSPLAGEEYLLLYWEAPICRMSTAGDVVLMYEKAFESIIPQVKAA